MYFKNFRKKTYTKGIHFLLKIMHSFHLGLAKKHKIVIVATTATTYPACTTKFYLERYDGKFCTNIYMDITKKNVEDHI